MSADVSVPLEKRYEQTALRLNAVEILLPLICVTSSMHLCDSTISRMWHGSTNVQMGPARICGGEVVACLPHSGGRRDLGRSQGLCWKSLSLCTLFLCFCFVCAYSLFLVAFVLFSFVCAESLFLSALFLSALSVLQDSLSLLYFCLLWFCSHTITLCPRFLVLVCLQSLLFFYLHVSNLSFSLLCLLHAILLCICVKDFVYISACRYVGMLMCLFMYVCVNVYLNMMYLYMCVDVCIKHAHTPALPLTHAHAHAPTFTHTHTRIHTYTHIHTHTYTYIHTDTHTTAILLIKRRHSEKKAL